MSWEMLQTLLLVAIVGYLIIAGLGAGRRHSRVLSTIRSEVHSLRTEIAAKMRCNEEGKQ